MAKISADEIEKVIVKEEYQHPEGTNLTICVLTLANGYVVVGTSACVDEADFDPDMGRDIARTKAVADVWKLEGYLSKQKHYELSNFASSQCEDNSGDA